MFNEKKTTNMPKHAKQTRYGQKNIAGFCSIIVLKLTTRELKNLHFSIRLSPLNLFSHFRGVLEKTAKGIDADWILGEMHL